MTSPRQITLRNPSPELARRLKVIADSRGKSLNSTILELLEQAVGVDDRRRRLARYTTWNDEDLADFERALEAQRTIDDELWR